MVTSDVAVCLTIHDPYLGVADMLAFNSKYTRFGGECQIPSKKIAASYLWSRH
jgi:hypothetical protein